MWAGIGCDNGREVTARAQCLSDSALLHLTGSGVDLGVMTTFTFLPPSSAADAAAAWVSAFSDKYTTGRCCSQPAAGHNQLRTARW
jgi:hypothetical protein